MLGAHLVPAPLGSPLEAAARRARRASCSDFMVLLKRCMPARIRPRTTALASYLDQLSAPGCPHAAAAAVAAPPAAAAAAEPAFYGAVREELKILLKNPSW